MKISVVSRGRQKLCNWLNDVCLVNVEKKPRKVEMCRVWHGDVLPIRADHGDQRTIYDVQLADNCQSHIGVFGDIPVLIDGHQYII